jgi:hypothetical protein
MIHLPSMNKSKTSSATFCHPEPRCSSQGAKDLGVNLVHNFGTGTKP